MIMFVSFVINITTFILFFTFVCTRCTTLIMIIYDNDQTIITISLQVSYSTRQNNDVGPREDRVMRADNTSHR